MHYVYLDCQNIQLNDVYFRNEIVSKYIDGSEQFILIYISLNKLAHSTQSMLYCITP